jgi:hypothetical protein
MCGFIKKTTTLKKKYYFNTMGKANLHKGLGELKIHYDRKKKGKHIREKCKFE